MITSLVKATRFQWSFWGCRNQLYDFVFALYNFEVIRWGTHLYFLDFQTMSLSQAFFFSWIWMCNGKKIKYTEKMKFMVYLDWGGGRGSRVKYNWPKISLFSANSTLLYFPSLPPLNPNRPLKFGSCKFCCTLWVFILANCS